MNPSGKETLADGFPQVDDLSGLSMAIYTRILGWELAELETFLIEVKKEWRSKAVHAYWPM